MYNKLKAAFLIRRFLFGFIIKIILITKIIRIIIIIFLLVNSALIRALIYMILKINNRITKDLVWARLNLTTLTSLLRRISLLIRLFYSNYIYLKKDLSFLCIINLKAAFINRRDFVWINNKNNTNNNISTTTKFSVNTRTYLYDFKIK